MYDDKVALASVLKLKREVLVLDVEMRNLEIELIDNAIQIGDIGVMLDVFNTINKD